MVVADFRAAVAGRDAAKITLVAFEHEVLAHNTTPLLAPVVDAYLEQSTQLTTELLEYHRTIFVNAPAGTDMEIYTLEHNDLFKRAIRTTAALKGIKMSFPVQPPTTTTTAAPHVRLPALELPTFGGNLQEWVAFRDIFEAAVGTNASLTKSQKLTYLKTCLAGKAAKHIRSLVLSDANYDISWKALTDRYQNYRELLFSILKRLTNQSSVSSSAVSVRALIDTTKLCTRSLEVLRILVEHWGAILLFIMFQKLDSQSKELWEQQLKDSSIPNLDDMYIFLEQRARALAASSTTSVQPAKPQQQRQPTQDFHTEPSASCKLECGGNAHPLYLCNKFKTMNVQDKISALKRSNTCFNCLSEGHTSSTCKNKHSCKTCGQRHHTLIHHDRQSQGQPQAESSSVTNHHIQHYDVNTGMIATALIQVIDDKGQHHTHRAMLDGGSPTSFITEACKTRIGLQMKGKPRPINGLQEICVATTQGVTTFAISTHFKSKVNMTVRAFVVPKISLNQPKRPYDTTEWSHTSNLHLVDPTFNDPAPCDILLGAEVFYAIPEAGKIAGPEGAPLAINSCLGWLIGGRTPMPLEELTTLVTDVQLDNTLKRFWEIETIPEETQFTEEERNCEEHFNNTYKRNAEGRFVVTLPMKQPASKLGSSRQQALSRLLQMEKRLSFHKNPDMEECNIPTGTPMSA